MNLAGVGVCVLNLFLGVSGEYNWPLGREAPITGSFGEYRDGHFHTGIDFSTGGVTGRPVFAVADGEVYRLADSLTGFGKAIYLRHPDGNLSVYAHLESFSGKISEEVRRRRARMAFRERLDVSVSSGAIKVRRGQKIGVSGESGAGLPHLHFELRRNEETPIHPFEFLPKPRDGIPPRLLSLTFLPASESAAIDGLPVGRSFNIPVAHADAPAETPILAGQFFVHATVYDLSSLDTSYRLSPMLVEFSRDDGEWKSIRFDRLSYAQNENKKVGLLYDLTSSAPALGLYTFRLFTDLPRPISPSSAPTGTFEADQLAAGIHQMSIRSQDVEGNRSEGHFIFKVAYAPPKISVQRRTDPRGQKIEPHLNLTAAGTQLLVRLLTSPASRPLTRGILSIEGHTWPLTDFQDGTVAGWFPFSRLRPGRIRFTVEAAAGETGRVCETGLIVFSRASQAGPLVLTSLDSRALCVLSSSALFRKENLNLFILPGTARNGPEESTMKPDFQFTLNPDGEPLAESARLYLAAPSSRFDSPPLGIYRYDSLGKRWSFVGSALDTEGILPKSRMAKIDRFGTYGLFDDATPPRIDLPPRRPYKKTDEMRWPVSDRGSGISEGKSFLRVDGRESEDWYYDADRGWARVSMAKLTRGKHRFDLSLQDRLGNTSSKTGTFEIK